MSKISKVKSVQANGTWESKHGLMYRFDYEFEDGISLQASHQKPENAFAEGSEVEYTIDREHRTYGKSGKVKKPEAINALPINNAKTPEEKQAIQKAIIYQSAFKEAVGYHNITGFTKPADSFNELCSTADAIAQFVIKKSGI